MVRGEIHNCRLILDEKPGRYYHLRIVTDAGELITIQVTKTVCETLKNKMDYTILENSNK